ncbi:MAG: 23S rRNA (guanosine(2251)-2'-O)-methyltransferase RlmB [Microscillaceae bacterium]|nr:23S rRNA (guanosine(2251)-2'-O)-methyltransferase RlmB [Microscillaceae bacterium]
MTQKDFVFGLQSVVETLKSDQTIDRILVQQELSTSTKMQEVNRLAKDKRIFISKVPLAKLNRVTMKNHQGVIAFISAVPFIPLSHVVPGIFEQGLNPLFVILDRITDVRNFGAICRTAECAGVQAVILPQRGAAQINSDALKTSSGALNHIPVCKEEDLRQTLDYLRQSGLQIVACTEKAAQSLYEIDMTGPTAILMGSEEDGISPNLLEKADFRAKIPLLGKIASLNVSVAAGVVMYEALRQRIGEA